LVCTIAHATDQDEKLQEFPLGSGKNQTFIYFDPQHVILNEKSGAILNHRYLDASDYYTTGTHPRDQITITPARGGYFEYLHVTINKQGRIEVTTSVPYNLDQYHKQSKGDYDKRIKDADPIEQLVDNQKKCVRFHGPYTLLPDRPNDNEEVSGCEDFQNLFRYIFYTDQYLQELYENIFASKQIKIVGDPILPPYSIQKSDCTIIENGCNLKFERVLHQTPVLCLEYGTQLQEPPHNLRSLFIQQLLIDTPAPFLVDGIMTPSEIDLVLCNVSQVHLNFRQSVSKDKDI
jgi:hypothetical protein